MTAFPSTTVPEPNSAASLFIALLGRFVVQVRGVPLRKLRTRQGERLLALLALRSEREHSRIALATLLWPDSTSESATLALLRRALTDLRAALGSEAARLLAPSQTMLRLDLSGDVFFDVREFDRAIASGTRESLDRAITLYHGPLLPGLEGNSDPEGVLQSEREQRERAFLGALEKRAAELHQSGEVERAIADLRHLLTLDPLRESASVALMELLTIAGDRVGALTEYQRLRQRLERELQTQPEMETQALFGRLQKGEATPTMTKPSTSEEQTTGFPAITMPLPIPLTRFFGREPELAMLHDWIVGPESTRRRLITMTGPPGIGKTRLALEAAHRAVLHGSNDASKSGTLSGTKDDQVWFVPFADVREPSQSAAVLARTLGVGGTGSPSLTVLATALQSRRTLEQGGSGLRLLVLDNLEHLLSPPDTHDGVKAETNEVTTLIQSLLALVPDLICLTTSRYPLLLSGEQILPLATLDVPDKGVPLFQEVDEYAAAFSGVSLFLDRARMADPRFCLTASNMVAIAEICWRLDGVPLALEMAAARTSELTPEQIVVQLSQHQERLSQQKRDVPKRHRSLYAAVDWSYHLLSQEARHVFAALSVFEGGLTLDAARAVCVSTAPTFDAPTTLASSLNSTTLSTSKVDDSLGELLRASLLLREPHTADEFPLPVRYRFLEMVRAYAGERLREQGKAAHELSRRHAAYFLDRARILANVDLAEVYAAAAVLEADRPNLMRAFDTLIQSNDETDRSRAVLLARRLYRFFINRGPSEEALAMYRRALSSAPPPTEDADRETIQIWAKSWNIAADFARKRNEMDAAVAFLQQAIFWFDRIGDDTELSNCYTISSYVQGAMGSYVTAEGMADAALEYARRSGSFFAIGAALSQCGRIAAQRHDLVRSRQLHEEALDYRRRHGEVKSIAWQLARLAVLYGCFKEWDAARDLLAECLQICREHQLRYTLMPALEACALRADGMTRVADAVTLSAARSALGSEVGSTEHELSLEQHALLDDRQRLHLGQAAYQAAWEQGRQLSWAQAMSAAEDSLKESSSLFKASYE